MTSASSPSKSGGPDPAREVDDALSLVIGLFAASGDQADGDGSTIVAFGTGQDLDTLIPALRRLAGA